MRDAVGWDGASDVDDAAAVGHLVFAGVLAGVVVVDGVHDAQVEQQLIQHLGDRWREEKITQSPIVDLWTFAIFFKK